MSFGQRIKTIRTSQKPKLTQTEFGQRLGVSKDVVANLEYDRVDPAESMIRLICQTYNINYAWLKTGEGEMEPVPVEDDTPGLLMARYRKGSPAVRRLLRAFAALDDDWYDKLEAAIRHAEEMEMMDETTEDQESSGE